MKVSATLPMVFQGSSLAEAMARTAEAGVDGVEFFEWEETDRESLTAVRDEHDLSFAATLAAGAGSSIPEASPAMTNPDSAERAITDIERSLEAAAAMDCASLIVTVGAEQEHYSRERQRDTIVSVLEAVAPAAEEFGVTVVVEPLNVLVDHPGYFLTSTAEGIGIVNAVDSPRIKLLYDVYHQQISEGNVIETMTTHLDAIGHVHIADVPGRHEPGTGELNYPNVLVALADAGYEGFVGCEFSPIGDPVEALAEVVGIVDARSG